MYERFLPIGTVVLLKGGTKEVMITTYCVFPTNKQYKEGQEVSKKKVMFEYGGCTYPEGIIDSNTICAFNHSDIERVCYPGYQTEASVALSKQLNANYELYKQQYETQE